MPITEGVVFVSTHSFETDGDEILRFPISLRNQGNNSVWIDRSNVNSGPSWLQILELGKDNSLTPFTGTGQQPTS